ncbi:MAG: hypothetical protein MZV63_25940 [Marinilabiliales bacterium]|nr:hypothetical protein [Marinilabiliales bacterium]
MPSAGAPPASGESDRRSTRRPAPLISKPLPGRSPAIFAGFPGCWSGRHSPLRRDSDVLAVPAEIVALRPDGSRSVFVVDGDLARQRKVTTGLEGAGWVEITGGLVEGENVIIRGFEKLKDGAAIALPGKGPKPVKTDGSPSETKGKR